MRTFEVDLIQKERYVLTLQADDAEQARHITQAYLDGGWTGRLTPRERELYEAFIEHAEEDWFEEAHEAGDVSVEVGSADEVQG